MFFFFFVLSLHYSSYIFIITTCINSNLSFETLFKQHTVINKVLSASLRALTERRAESKLKNKVRYSQIQKTFVCCKVSSNITASVSSSGWRNERKVAIMAHERKI